MNMLDGRVLDSLLFILTPRIEGGEVIWYRERHPVASVALD